MEYHSQGTITPYHGGMLIGILKESQRLNHNQVDSLRDLLPLWMEYSGRVENDRFCTIDLQIDSTLLHYYECIGPTYVHWDLPSETTQHKLDDINNINNGCQPLNRSLSTEAPIQKDLCLQNCHPPKEVNTHNIHT